MQYNNARSGIWNHFHGSGELISTWTHVCACMCSNTKSWEISLISIIVATLEFVTRFSCLASSVWRGFGTFQEARTSYAMYSVLKSYILSFTWPLCGPSSPVIRWNDWLSRDRNGHPSFFLNIQLHRQWHVMHHLNDMNKQYDRHSTVYMFWVLVFSLPPLDW